MAVTLLQNCPWPVAPVPHIRAPQAPTHSLTGPSGPSDAPTLTLFFVPLALDRLFLSESHRNRYRDLQLHPPSHARQVTVRLLQPRPLPHPVPSWLEQLGRPSRCLFSLVFLSLLGLFFLFGGAGLVQKPMNAYPHLQSPWPLFHLALYLYE